jgi:hypothetical protein
LLDRVRWQENGYRLWEIAATPQTRRGYSRQDQRIDTAAPNYEFILARHMPAECADWLARTADHPTRSIRAVLA